MTIAEYMRHCLQDPEHGYYKKQRAIGGQADFITAPEVSQLFGELIAIWVIDTWQKIGTPPAFSLIELGPGRGTLMDDVLRTIEKVAPICLNAIHLHLVDINTTLIERQKERLAIYPIKKFWHSSLDTTGGGPFILVANEFLDALPIRQYQFTEKGWTERLVGLDENEDLIIGLAPADKNVIPPIDPQIGDILEVSADMQDVITSLLARMNYHESTALFVDYGRIAPAFGDTFQALKKHQKASPFETPGEADLTAHVDFYTLAQVAQMGGQKTHLTTQGEFLLQMGLLERAGQLGATLPIEAQEKIRNDVERLAAPNQMGELFKVMAITGKDVVPHGFA